MKRTVIALVFLMFACSNGNSQKYDIIQTQDGHIIKREFNDKGVLIYEQQFLKNDTGLIEDGFVRWYSDDGDTLESGSLVGGKLDGISKFYYPNGRIKQKLHWELNALLGPQYQYYEDGSLMLFINYLKPTSFRADTANKFMVHFNPAHEVDSIKGQAFVPYLEEKYETFDTAQIDFFCADDPEGMKGQLAISVKRKNGVTLDTFFQADAKKFFSLLIFQYRYPCIEGSARLEAKYLLQTGKNKRLIVCDSQVVQINVGK